MINDFIKSFNPKSYKDFIFQSFKKSFIFFIIFVIILSAIMAFIYNLRFNKKIPQIISFIERNFNSLLSLPVIEIKNGELVLPSSPFEKKWEGFVFLIRPSKDLSALEKYSKFLLITKRNIFLKWEENGSIEQIPLKNIGNLKIIVKDKALKITKDDHAFLITPLGIKNFFKKLSLFLYPLLFTWFFSWFLLTKPLHIFIFTLFSLLFSHHLNLKFSYKNLLNLGIYAILPPTTAAIIKEMINISLPFFWLIYSFIYIFFLMQVIKIAKEEKWSE